MSTNKAVPLSRIVGGNLRFFREAKRQTQADAARHLAAGGLEWTRDQVSTLENGNRETISFEELFAIAYAYAVPIARLLDGDDEQVIAINARTFATLDMARRAFSQQAARLPTHRDEAEHRRRREEWEREHPPERDEADQAVAEKLDQPVAWVIEAARELWGHTLTEEREKRLGDTSELSPRTLQAKRGAMTRKLTAEIEPHIERLQFPDEYVLYERRGSTGEKIEGQVVGKGTRDEKRLAESPAWTHVGPYDQAPKS